MKNELENIDRLFRDLDVDETATYTIRKRWRLLKWKLFYTELSSMNLTNVNWNYWYVSGIAAILLFLFIYPFDVQNSTEIVDGIENINHSVIQHQPDGEINTTTHSNKSYTDEKKILQVENPINENESLGVINEEPSTSDKANQIKQIETENQPTETYKASNQNLTFLASRNVTINVTNTDNEISSNGNLQPKETGTISPKSDLNNNTKPDYFSIGAQIGAIYFPENTPELETIYQPGIYAGVNLRYNRKKLFISAGLDFSSYKSEYQSTYLYDTLLGTLTTTGYDIVDVIDQNGDTIQERNLRSEIVDVYDTVNSDDYASIRASSTVFAASLSIGSHIYQYGNFYTAVFGGIMMKVLVSRNTSVPNVNEEDRNIIRLVSEQQSYHSTEFYLQGGLSLGYHLSRQVSIEISTSYNHILGSDANAHFPLSGLRAGFGVHYKL